MSLLSPSGAGAHPESVAVAGQVDCLAVCTTQTALLSLLCLWLRDEVTGGAVPSASLLPPRQHL